MRVIIQASDPAFEGRDTILPDRVYLGRIGMGDGAEGGVIPFFMRNGSDSAAHGELGNSEMSFL